MTSSISLSLPADLAPVERDFLNLGHYQPAARRLTVNSRYVELDGKPWLPVMGEFHYSRYPADEWEAELRKMRAGGVSIVASYVFWNHHEAECGQFDWAGSRDLRRFVQLAAAAGLYVYLRPGPWVHAESRYGGFPDWLIGIGELRCNAPAYLAEVTRFYQQIGAQVAGLMWADGGPVIGVQLENEYDRIGPGCGAEHIAELKRIAIEAGLRVPLYTVTGWPTLDIPPHDVVPVSGAYPDGFWQGSSEPLPPSGVFVFNTERAIGEMGNVGGTPAEGRVDKTHYPFFLAEAGGGMHVSYHRRPTLMADDLAATTLVQIGSGASLYGYYMYHGGTNPLGPRRYNETQDTGYPNDVSVLGYDFRAPLGQYGQTRESYGRLRCLHLFLQAFGEELAPMEAVMADGASLDAAAREPLRVAARGAGEQGFVFINNHVRHHPLPDFPAVQISVKTAAGEQRFPQVDVPSGAYMIWPLGARIGAAVLRNATVQPLTRWAEDGRTTWVAFVHPAIAPSLAFDAATVSVVDAGGAAIETAGDALIVRPAVGASATRLKLVDVAGAQHEVLLLDRPLAEQAARVQYRGRERLAFSAHATYQRGADIVVASPAAQAAAISFFPGDDLVGEVLAGGLVRVTAAEASAAPYAAAIAFDVLHDEPTPPAVRLGPHISWRAGPVPLAPDDAEFENATTVRLSPPAEWAGIKGRLLAEINYVGDAARLYADGVLVDDNFFDGEPWYVGLDRFVRNGQWPTLELRIVAARPELPIFLEAAARERLNQAAHRGCLATVTLTAWREALLASAI
ncbi:beta-galactosidase [Niveibacterium sp.]|uniref:beta-galactosidase n=1 Tax=Niveibacterium sp. TaxID=2017444 RepID=UPI0035AF36CA